MGVFDEIYIETICPCCRTKMVIKEQIKWTNKRRCHVYNLGDNIDADEGVYDFATKGRPQLVIRCSNCDKNFWYSIKVKDGILKEIILNESL